MDKKFFAKDFISPGRKKAKKKTYQGERERERIYFYYCNIENKKKFVAAIKKINK